MMVSIVVCTYNRSDRLRTTLRSLEEMSVPGDLAVEIIVVDNNSRDNTKGVVEEFMATSPHEVRYIVEEKQGLSHARNQGITKAGGGIISFLDDDVMVKSDWLTKVVEAFRTYDTFVVGGKAVLKYDVPRPAWLSNQVAGSLGEFDKGEEIIIAEGESRESIGIGANLSFRREAFARAGLFDVDLGRKANKLIMGEETELYWRVRDNGLRCLYYPSAVVYHCIGTERINKNYIRRWFYRIGEWNCFVDMFRRRSGYKTILGIPRHKYREALEDMMTSLWSAAKGAEADAFYREVCFVSFVGYCMQRIKGSVSGGKNGI